MSADSASNKHEHANLTGHLLIAMPALQDANFSQTVTYICEHNANGALGITLNRPTEFQLTELLQQLGIHITSPAIGLCNLLAGGPVQPDRGFVLHTPIGQWESSLKIDSDIAITSSRDILQSIADDNGPKNYLIALGYAGWDAGQLESELSANAWLSCPANQQILFHTPVANIWQASATLLGIDLRLLSNDAGHA